MEFNIVNYVVSTISMMWLPLLLLVMAIVTVSWVMNRFEKTDPIRQAFKGTRTCLTFLMVLVVVFGMALNVKVHGPRFDPKNNATFQREVPQGEIRSIAPVGQTDEERLKETNEKTTSGNIPR